jgi:hypothetical protein
MSITLNNVAARFSFQKSAPHRSIHRQSASSPGLKLNGPESSPSPSHRIGRVLTSSKFMTPPHDLRCNSLGRSTAATRTSARPVLAPFRSPSWALCCRPLHTLDDTINDHLVCGTIAILLCTKTALLQISDKAESGQAEKQSAPTRMGVVSRVGMAYCCDFSSSVACRLGSGGCLSSARRASTSRLAVAYSPSVIC